MDINPQKQLSEIRLAISKGKFSEAKEKAQTLIDAKINNDVTIESLYMQAVACRLDKKIEQAQELNRNILAINPNHARAHQELAYLYLTKEDDITAAHHFYQATLRNPALVSSWNALFDHYGKTNNQQALAIAKTNIDYLIQLPKPILQARDLFYENKLNDADHVCRQYLRQHKHDADGMTLLAEIGIALKVYGEAEFLLESCLELHPKHLAAGLEYAKLLNKMGRFQDAFDVSMKLEKHFTNHATLQTIKASALVGLSRIGDAVALYEKILLLNPNQAGIYLLLGHAHKAAGELDKAVNYYQEAYKHRSGFGDAYWSLANTKTYSFTEAEKTHMLELTRSDLAVDDEIHICFALGKALEDEKAFSKSFAFYQRGNALKQSQLAYDPAYIDAQVNNQKRVFTTSLFEKLKGVGEKSPDPIFIVGLPRAGSTLLEQILASHSKVDGTMELHNIISLVARLRGQQNRYPDIMSDLEVDYFQRFGQQYIADTRVYRDKAPFFIDKMPNNFMFIGLIKLILPNAKIIDARREPMACCFSGFKQLFGEGQEFTYGLENIGRYYNAYLDMMAHWEQVLPGFVLRVQHEDVIDDLESQVRRMLAFCELDFEPACLEFYKTQRTIKTPSSEQVRQPIFKSSMQQWQHFEADLKPLIDTLSARN